MPNLEKTTLIGRLSLELAEFLPASGNPHTSFPIAANAVGLGRYWPQLQIAKKALLSRFLSSVYDEQPNKLPSFITEVVRQSVGWRIYKNAPLTKDEVLRLDRHIKALGFSIPELSSESFLKQLAAAQYEKNASPEQKNTIINEEELLAVYNKLLSLTNTDPHKRGYQFESLLNKLFEIYDLHPNNGFRVTGEQIDGSFEFDGDTFLVEAKWHNSKIDAQQLYGFDGKITGKAEWTKGLFVSYSGFTEQAIQAFQNKGRTSMICMDGYDLSLICSRRISLIAALKQKKRHAGQTGEIFLSLAKLV